MIAAKQRILVVEDSAFTRLGLRNYLEKQEYQVYEAANIADAERTFEESRPDIAILDISLPSRAGEQPGNDGREGLQLALYIKKRNPKVGVILLSGHLGYYQEFHEITKTYRGIAYLFKDENPRNELINIIDIVNRGGIWVAPEIANYTNTTLSASLFETEYEKIRDILYHFKDLSDRKKDIIRLVALSYDNDAIAKELCLSSNTVSSHLTKIYSEVGLGEYLGRSEKRTLLTKAYLVSKTSKHTD
jgi:DNA-binding NarL/FixJ family response regulator